MTKYEEVVNRELKHSFYTGTRRNDYHATRVKEMTGKLTEGLENHQPFKTLWVELFTVYPEQESLRCMQRLFKAFGRPIPAGYEPVDDSL
jgi:hypothetical protein